MIFLLDRHYLCTPTPMSKKETTRSSTSDSGVSEGRGLTGEAEAPAGPDWPPQLRRAGSADNIGNILHKDQRASTLPSLHTNVFSKQP